jgi:hypothetical protein
VAGEPVLGAEGGGLQGAQVVKGFGLTSAVADLAGQCERLGEGPATASWSPVRCWSAPSSVKALFIGMVVAEFLDQGLPLGDRCGRCTPREPVVAQMQS